MKSRKRAQTIEENFRKSDESLLEVSKKDFRKKKSIVGTLLMLILALGLALGGGFLIVKSLHSDLIVPPDITSSIIAPSNQKPVGPTQGLANQLDEEVFSNNFDSDGENGIDLSPAKMENNTIFIPAINAYARIDTSSGKLSQGELVLPKPTRVTRWLGGSDVGDKQGSILIAGHISFNNTRGALYNLALLKPGNIAFVKNARGLLGTFQLASLESTKKTELPAALWTKAGPLTLHVVTCGGQLSQQANGSWHFDSNLIASFVPVNSNQ